VLPSCFLEIYLRGNVFTNSFPRNGYMSQYFPPADMSLLYHTTIFQLCTYGNRVASDFLLLRLLILVSKSSKSWAEEHGANKGADTTQQMDRAATGEIHVSEPVQPADFSPNPMRYRGIHNSWNRYKNLCFTKYPASSKIARLFSFIFCHTIPDES
jgi:hypothetical protein